MFEKGAEARENLKLAVPIVGAQLGAMAMGLVDTAIVGRVGETALAGVSLGNTLLTAVTVPAYGVFLALEPVASQAIGAGELAHADAAERAGLRLAVYLTVPVAIIACLGLGLLPLLEVDEAARPDARAYLVARLPSLMPLFVFLAKKTSEQAAGRTRAALEAVIVANVVHVVAGCLAVFVFALGAAGAGWATSASSTVLAIWVLARSPRPNPAPRERVAGVQSTLLRLGFPIGMQMAAEVGIFSLIALLMGRIGGRAAAAHQIAMNLASMSFMGALGIAQATSIRVGTAIGEGSSQRARRAGFTGIVLGVAAMSLWATAFALAPALLARLFTPEAQVVELAALLIRIAALFQLVDGAQVVAAGALRGAADTRWPLALNIVVHWGLGLPVALYLAFRAGLGAAGLWFGLTTSLVIIAGSLIARFSILTRRAVVRI